MYVYKYDDINVIIEETMLHCNNVSVLAVEFIFPDIAGNLVVTLFIVWNLFS